MRLVLKGLFFGNSWTVMRTSFSFTNTPQNLFLGVGCEGLYNGDGTHVMI